ncbi:hypothetical protein B0T24DRAFT_654698 [Lasiosphaeria ovina]|uniref:DUF2461 domain-containing protein n=1 Tax=Lasiosphaeria ovina TaxID=92902 RepID=A0AAE0NN16_9PEZI|nr:hypothetical protein B0T24DRAFT_654698 [Lasiosphaeria ovina]
MAARKRKPAATVAEAEKLPPAEPSRRRSARVSSSTKSKYFEAASDESEFDDVVAIKRRRKSAQPAATPKKTGRKGAKKAAAEDEDAEDEYKEEAVEGEDDEDDDANDKADDSDDEIDEDAPPKVTFIPLPKLRDTGGVEYADERLHKNTFAFLKDLKANNKRSWLKLHDDEYRRSLKDWESYAMTLTDKIVAADETIPELPFKDINFRIYRDIRFSNDPTPYKPHYSAAWSRTGRKGPYACYYVHAEPGACMVGGGLWHPDGGALQKLRASIDERPQRWRRVLMDPEFRRVFLPKVAPADSTSPASKGKKKKAGDDHDDTAVIQAFAESNAEGALKTRPKGFIPDHRDMALLKLRNFVVGKKLPDDVFTADGSQDEVARVVKAMVGFVTHLNRIVMPDPNGDDDDDDDDSDGEENGDGA